jgi:hypothetical protein
LFLFFGLKKAGLVVSDQLESGWPKIVLADVNWVKLQLLLFPISEATFRRSVSVFSKFVIFFYKISKDKGYARSSAFRVPQR